MERLLLRFIRTSLGGLLTRLLFTSFSFVLPMKRLRDTSTLMAFFHPQPSHKLHILIVAKQKYETILDIPPDEIEFKKDLFDTVKSLIKEYNLEEGAYRLIMNGGDYQDVDHLHFHLIADDDL